MKHIMHVPALAIAIAAFSSSAYAQDYTNGGTVSLFTTSSPQSWVAVDGSSAPVDTNQINPDGSFKPSCAGCAWVDPATLTQAQRDAIAADPHAATYYPTAGARRTSVLTDTTTGDSSSVTRTDGGVVTSASLSDGTHTTAASAKGVSVSDTSGNSTVLSATGLTTTGTVSAGEVYAGGVNVGATLSHYGSQIGTLENLYAGQQVQINNLSGRMDKAYAGIAMAGAMHDPQVDPGHTFGLSFSAADFSGVAGFAGSAKWRINNNFAVGGGGAFSDKGEGLGRVYGELQW